MTNANDIDKLQFEKVIYAKTKPFSNKQLADILRLEVEYHLSKHPDLLFVGVGKEIKNADKSISFKLQFKLK